MCLCMYLFVNSDVFQIFVKINKKKKYGIIKSYIQSFQNIFSLLKTILIQKLNKSLVHVKKNVYDLHYHYNGQLYKIRFTHHRGPQTKHILLITNKQSDDLTQFLLPYMGPKYNFYGIPYKPSDFDQEEMHFYMSDGSINIVTRDNIIKL